MTYDKKCAVEEVLKTKVSDDEYNALAYEWECFALDPERYRKTGIIGLFFEWLMMIRWNPKILAEYKEVNRCEET